MKAEVDFLRKTIRIERELHNKSESQLCELLDGYIEDRNAALQALKLAAVRLEILTGRIRGCHAVSGMHPLIEEAEEFCRETQDAVDKLNRFRPQEVRMGAQND